MSYGERHTVAIVTATGGGATAYTPVVMGRIIAVQYVKATAAVALASTVDFTITGENTGVPVLSKANVTADFTNSPMQPAHTVSGAAITNGEQDIVIARERVKVAVASGGNTKQGTIHIVVA